MAVPARPLTPVPAPAAPRTRGRGQRLTLGERLRLLELHKANPTWSFRQLADAAQVSPETARLTCIAAGKQASELMAAFALPALKDWIKASRAAAAKGDHRAARDWLLFSGALEPLPEPPRGGGPTVILVNASLPGMPNWQPPPVTIAPEKATVPEGAPDTAGHSDTADRDHER